MTNQKKPTFLSFVPYLMFKVIGPKLRPGSFKHMMDVCFIVFEKMAENFDVIASLYLEMYEEIVEKEIALAAISDSDRVLVIGCGSLPVTPLLLTMKTKAKIHAIDCDEKAVTDGLKFLTRKNLKNDITLEYADGSGFPAGNFDVIVVLYGVRNQEQVFHNLSKTMKPSARIVYRTMLDNDGKMRIDVSSFFIMKNSTQSYSLGVLDSLLLVKK